jgi:hypothetical protein
VQNLPFLSYSPKQKSRKDIPWWKKCILEVDVGLIYHLMKKYFTNYLFLENGGLGTVKM